MTNVTITVSEDVLRRARVRAVSQGTSVNAVLRAELTRYASGGGDLAADAFLKFAREHPGASRPGERWSRDDLYADRLGPRTAV